VFLYMNRTGTLVEQITFFLCGVGWAT